MKKQNRLLLTLVLLGAWSSQAQLVQYNFNQGSGTATNSGSASSADLTLGANASWGASGSGVSGQAGDYSFVGTSNYNSGAFSAAPITALNNLTSLTVTGWIKVSSWGADQDIFTTQTGYYSGFKLSVAASGELAMKDRGFADQTSTSGGVFDDNLGNWTFFALTWDGTGAATNAVNFYYGTTSSSSSLVSTINRSVETSTGTASDPLGVGNSANIPSYQWWDAVNGSLDDIRVYGSVLNSTSIENVRLAGLAAVPEPSTIASMGLGLAFLALRLRRRIAA
jgi:hypothetical protein